MKAESFKNYFPVNSQLIYLNGGSVSFCPKEVIAAETRYRLEYEQNPTLALFQCWERLWEVQNKIANFFGANGDDFFLRSNVTLALSDFILGVEIERGEILVSDLEYGAIVNACRLKAKKEGHSFRAMHLPGTESELQNLTEDQLLEKIISELKPQTKLLMLSQIMTGTGLIIPIEKISVETRKRGIIFVVDGAHGPGSQPVDFRQLSNVDCYGGNVHKWMMGPKGTGFGWVAKEIQERVQPMSGHWTVFEKPGPFEKFGGPHGFAARMLVSSTVSVPPFYAFQELIDFWNMLGPDKIFEQLKLRTNYAQKCFEKELSWDLVSPSERLRGPLVSFVVPNKWSQEGFKLLHRVREKTGVQIACPFFQNKLLLRLSPHIWNDLSEIEDGILKLREFFK